MDNVTLISSNKNWLEQKAIDQLKKVALLPDVFKVVGLPDLHPGKTPVGTVIITENTIYPHLIGNDIGCGMSLFMTEIDQRKFNLDKAVKKLEAIQNLDEIHLHDLQEFLEQPLWQCLGTIGGGNHFAELQKTETIYDPELFKKFGYEENRLMVLIHSGSRGYGQMILDEFIKVHQAQNGLKHDSEAFERYLEKHNSAVEWGTLNRKLIKNRFLKALGINTNATAMIDSIHNSIFVKKVNDTIQYIHRKGAAPVDQGVVVIPGSRGSLTYLVIPTGDLSVSGFSLAHGAGRKWERNVCKARLEHRYTKESIKTTPLKGRVICHDQRLLFEEATECYKNIDTVIQSLVDWKLIKVIATFKPVLTYKG